MKVLGLLLMAASDDLLAQPVRKRLFGIIKREPGIHASEICRESGEAWGTVQYHLSLLQQNDMVQSVEAGRERRFFPPDIQPEVARLLGLLHCDRRQGIVSWLREHPGARQVDVCNALSVSRKAFRSAVGPLVAEGLVQEQKGIQTNRYYVDEGVHGVVSPSPDVV